MKKWMSLLISLSILFSGIAYANNQEKDDSFRMFLGRPILGETTSFRFVAEELPFELAEETIDLRFPLHYQLPAQIDPEHILINDETNPLSLERINDQTLRIKADLSLMDQVDIFITRQAGIFNPIEWPHPSSFAVAFLQSEYILVSQMIQLRSPNNTIHLSKPPALSRTSEWTAHSFEVEMQSNTARKIYYRINQGKEQQYNEPLKIQDGIHEIMFYGIRESGAKETADYMTFKVDTQPPQIQLLSPRDSHLTNQKEMVLEFMVSSFSPVKLMVEKVGEFLVPENGRIDINATLVPGNNVITYKAINAASHKASGSVQVMLDITPPYLEILSPRNNELICTSKIDIVGKAEIGSRVMVGDTQVSLDRFGNFVIRWVPDEGKNQIVIRAFDPAGNETRRELQFLYFPGTAIKNIIGEPSATMNGVEKPMIPASFQDQQTAEHYFPLRFMAEALSYQLQWVPEGSYVSMKRKDREIRVRAVDSLVQVRQDGEIIDIRLQNVPTMHQGSMMIPSEFIKRILMGDVLLDTLSRRVIIHFCEEL